MTDDPTNEAVSLSGLTVLSPFERDTEVRHFLAALNIALEATKLAVEAANGAPRAASFGCPTLAQTFERWAAANVVVHEVFGKLYTQTRYMIDVIKPVMPTD
jgi:hypothetical protein